MSATALLRDWPLQRANVLADPALALKWVKRANGSGEYFLAVEIAESFLKSNEGTLDRKLRLTFQQQMALALARAGFSQKAKDLLEELRAQGSPDAETLGLLGSVYKALSGKAQDLEEKSALLKTSRDFYQLGFQDSGDTYCGINAAALSVLLNDLDVAKTLAEKTLAAVPENNNYWDLATKAEASLILGQLDQAREQYVTAGKAAGERWADIASTRKQCRLLSLKLHGRRELLDECFPSGTVGFFVGHMMDAPDRAQVRFPATAIPSVTERIEAWLQANAIRFSYSSAACGGDLLFLECAQAIGVETHVMLPFVKEVFLETSVALHGGEWVSRFDAALAKAASVTVLNEDVPDLHASSYDFTNRMISARASARAAAYDIPSRGLALWDGKPGDGSGGTADAVGYWCRGRVPVDTIHPTNPAFDGRYDVSQPVPQKPFPRIYSADPSGVQTAVASLLYLQINGYQSLREKDFRLFFQHLLGGISESLAAHGWFPGRYGFGGQYLFVWDKVRDAGLAALDFMAILQQGARELPATMSFNLCLHSAPLQLMVNPILNQYTHEGAAVTRLQLLLEKLSPGFIYATEPFADLTAFEKIRDFSCEYTGTVGVSQDSSGSRIYQVTK
jgi:hypothetical protein